MTRHFLLVLAITACGVTVAAAQGCQDVINTRQALMKKSAAAGKVASSMIRGETPFDLAKAKQIFAAFDNDASQLPVLFPECSKTGDHTTAAPSIWQQPAQFKARIDKYTADVKAAEANTKDLATFKASMQAIGKDCGGCHQVFRTKQS